MGNLITPKQRLTIAFRQGGEIAPGPIRFAYVANRTFYASLLIGRPYYARTRHTVIVSTQFQQSGMKMNLVSATFQYGTAQIVVQNHPRCTRPGGKSVDV